MTPGAEPSGRVPLAVVLDADAVLSRHDLSASIEGVRRWMDVAALVAPGGRALVVGSSVAPAVQALVRADPIGFATAQLRERREAGLPPAVHAAVIEAPAGSTASAEVKDAAPGATVLGPAHAGGGQRWIVLHAELDPLVNAVRSVLARRSASKTIAGISIRIDPLGLAT